MYRRKENVKLNLIEKNKIRLLSFKNIEKDNWKRKKKVITTVYGGIFKAVIDKIGFEIKI